MLTYFYTSCIHKGWHLKYLYMHMFWVLPYYPLIIQQQYFKCHFFLKKNLAIHTEKLKAQENNGWDVLNFPFTRQVVVVFQGKRRQSIYSRGKKDWKDSKRTEGLEWQPRFVGCSTIYTLVRAYLGDIGYVPQAKSSLWRADGMPISLVSVSRNVCFTQFILNKHFSFYWNIILYIAENRRDDDAA